MKESVFVRNNLYDERDGLKDLIYANYGNTKRIKEHLFPNSMPEIHDTTVDKFVSKYSQWLSNKIDKSEDPVKFINKDVIKSLLTQELVKRK
jgi:uncharacterized protein YPO0396